MEKQSRIRWLLTWRWFRYSLRTALVGTLLVALGLGWFESRVRSARRQRAASEALKEFGGETIFDYEFAENGSVETQSPTPRWLVDWRGVDPFSEVALVKLNHIEVDDAMLAHLSAFPRLRELQLFRTTVNDEHLATIAAIEGLRVLDVSSDAITDTGAIRLTRVRSLQTLWLGGKSFTESAIAELRASLPHTEIYRYGKMPDEPWKMPEDDGTGYQPIEGWWGQ